MRLFDKNGLEIKDHELVRRTNLNTLSPLYNKRQLKFSSAKYRNDFHKATITSHRTSENEREFRRISKNNLHIAKLFAVGNVDWTRIENVIKFVYYCLINPVLFDASGGGARCSLFVDRTFNKIDIVRERYPLAIGQNRQHTVHDWSSVSLVILDNFIIRLIHVVNGDHNFVRVFTSDNICARFSKCKIIVSSFVYNCVNNVCDTFFTKWINCVDLNRTPPCGFDILLNNHNRRCAKRAPARTKPSPVSCVNKLRNVLRIVDDTFHLQNDHKVFQSNELANENNLPPTQTNLKLHNNGDEYNNSGSKCRIAKSSIKWHRQLAHKSFPLSSSLERSVGNRRFSNGAILSKTNNFGCSVLKHHFLLIFFILITCTPIISASMHNIKYSTNTVKTKYGLLRGIMVRANPSVEAFLGVPYATPPVGSLRFMPPVTPSTWRNTRLADRFSPVCPQVPPVSGDDALFDIPRGRLAQLRRILPLLANQSEDCLYLNLYVPRSDETNEIIENSMATIVYVHGESYEWNSGSIYDGSILAAHGNVIVVTINFRLGVLGFLKTGAKGSAQGNFGLMDLVAGLHWLRENLPAFNGDPSKVVLMGHGTGASLANILIVSPVASDLINRAILISGSALSPWAIQKDPLYVKRKVAEGTGCHGDLLDDDMAPCLRTKPLADLLSVTIDSPRFLPGFAPFVDGTVIVNPATSAAPLTLPAGSAIASTAGIELADFPTKELLFGLTSMESYLDLSAQDLEFGFNETRRDRILRTYVRNVYHYHLNEIYSALKNEYTDWERPPRNPMGSRDASLELLSDGHTAAPLVRLGYLHSLRGGRSYFLHFRHQSGERDFPQRGGSVRGEDVPFCLGLPISPLFPYNYTKQDIKISRILVQYLANFAQTGNPNGISSSSSTSSVDTSRPFTHNHIATPIGDHSKLTVTMTDNNKNSINGGFKQKRQTNFQRNKRNHHELVRDVDSGESDEVDENDEDELAESAEVQPNHVDRLDDIANLRIPFWDTYDSINQLYLEMGDNIEIRNHYRGHKLSMWLSLIPQLHSPGDIADLSMRHHHFLEESAQYYDGIVRPQSLQRPSLPKVISPPPPPPTTTTTSTTTQAPKTEQTSVTSVQSTTTECPPNSTIVPTLAATRPQQNQGTNSITNNNNLLRRLANSQYQSYTTALTVTVAVGCFLLLLNILIFAGIYYQREKRATDAKKKEELTEAEIRCSPSINHDKLCGKGGSSRKSSLQSVSGFNPVTNFGEYSCYDEKIQCKEKHNLADICSVELPLQEFKCANGNDSNTSSLRRSTKSDSYKHNLNNLMLYPPTYTTPHPSEPGSSTSNGLVMYSQFSRATTSTTEQCNQSTQSDIPDVQDVGTGVMQTDVDDNNDNSGECSPGIPEPPPPPRSAAPYQGGILRQQGGPSTPAASKKRVQIQEISV